MTLPVQAVRTVYTGNNTAAPIPIAHESTAIWFRDKSHIHVAALDSYGVEVPLVEGTDYDISGNITGGFYKNGAVVPRLPIADDLAWAIWREQPLEQDAQFGFNSPYDSTIAERTHDRSRQLDQEQADAIVRAIKISRFATAPQPNLPRDITDKFLVGQADGTLWPLAPAAPGTVCVDADGRAFVVPPDYGGSTGINRYTFGTSPHTGPIPGDVWVNSTTGNVAFWLPLGAGYYDWYFYDDGDIQLPFAGTGIANTIARSDHSHALAEITGLQAALDLKSNVPVGAPERAYVATIAALKALSTVSGYVVATVAGYYAANDLGGGEYIWSAASTAIDNGGTVIIPASAPGSGRWLRTNWQNVSVLHFGAKGTDDAADRPAFVAAVNWLGSVGGGDLEVPGNGRSYLIQTEVFVPSNVRIWGSGGKRPRLYRSAMSAVQSSYLALRDPAGVAALSWITVENIDFEHAPINHQSFTATAAQTVFTYGCSDILSTLDLLVFKNGVLQSPSALAYTYSPTTVTLATPCTAGDIVLIAKARAGAYAGAVVSIGASATVRNHDIIVRDCEILGNCSLYCGIVMQWTDDVYVADTKSYAIVNRGNYTYGRCSNQVWDDNLIDGYGTGIFAGIRVTDYAVDNNSYDGSNPHKNVVHNRPVMLGDQRGISWNGSQTLCGANDITVDDSDLAVLLQESASQEPSDVFVRGGTIRNAYQGVRSLVPNFDFSNLRIIGGYIGLFCDTGAISPSASERGKVSGVLLRGQTNVAALFQNQKHLNGGAIEVYDCANLSVQMIDCANCSLDAKVSGALGGGVYIQGTSDRNTILIDGDANANYDVQISAASVTRTRVRGRAASTGGVIDLGTTSSIEVSA